MTTRVDRLLELIDRQCRLRPDGRTTLAALATVLYGGTSAADVRATTQLIYRARLAGHVIDFPRNGPRAGRLRRVNP